MAAADASDGNYASIEFSVAVLVVGFCFAGVGVDRLILCNT